MTELLPPNLTLADRLAYFMRWLLTGIGLEQRRTGLGWEMREAIAKRLAGLWTRMARLFAAVRSVIGTARCRGIDAYQAITATLRGQSALAPG